MIQQTDKLLSQWGGSKDDNASASSDTIATRSPSFETQLKGAIVDVVTLGSDDGFHTTFGDGKWKISKGSRVIAKGNKSDTLYPLHVSSVSDHVVTITE